MPVIVATTDATISLSPFLFDFFPTRKLIEPKGEEAVDDVRRAPSPPLPP